MRCANNASIKLNNKMAYTLFDKIWNKHVVNRNEGFPDTLYIDVHLINKVTSPEAFEGLRKRKISVLRPWQTLVCDYKQAARMGTLGVLAIGMGEFQVEQVLATQSLLIDKPRRMKIVINGILDKGLGTKDINHYLLSEISADGANGYFIEYDGDTILNLDIASRMAICRMSREIGALGGIIAPDQKTFSYLSSIGVPSKNKQEEGWLCYSESLYSDQSSVFDEVIEFDAEDIGPGNYGTGLSKLMQTKPFNERSGMIMQDGAAILAGYNDTDYLLSRLDTIKDYESSMTNKVFDEV